MAEADPKHLPHDGDDPPTKRKKTTSSTVGCDSSPWKHPDEVADTATSKPIAKEEEIEEVDFDTIEIMQDILSYRNRKGVYPFESPDDLRRFCTPYVRMGVGNAGGWSKKMVEMKNRFKNESAPMADGEKKEFELWKKIWGNERKGDEDDDPGVGSCK